MTSPHCDREILIDYLHGELTVRDDAAVLLHLDACAACRALHDEEAALGEILRSAAARDELAFPSMIKAKVWAAVRDEQPSWLDRLRAWGPRIAVPAA
jgi:predicted anti-sigma-YlaC factor YlaD